MNFVIVGLFNALTQWFILFDVHQPHWVTPVDLTWCSSTVGSSSNITKSNLMVYHMNLFLYVNCVLTSINLVTIFMIGSWVGASPMHHSKEEKVHHLCGCAKHNFIFLGCSESFCAVIIIWGMNSYDFLIQSVHLILDFVRSVMYVGLDKFPWISHKPESPSSKPYTIYLGWAFWVPSKPYPIYLGQPFEFYFPHNPIYNHLFQLLHNPSCIFLLLYLRSLLVFPFIVPWTCNS